MEKLTTSNGNLVPSVGLGTYPFQGSLMADVVKKALTIGYRLIDTSDDYRGESGIGMAVKELSDIGLKREDIFLQTKITDNDSYDDEPLAGLFFNKYSKFMKRHSVEEVVREKVQDSLFEMHTDYIDSLLIHQPYPDYYEEIWDVLIQLKKEGLVRYIGVSNFYKRHLEQLKGKEEFPQINQIYLSPIGIKQQDVDYCNNENIQLMTFSPLIDIRTRRVPAGNGVFNELQGKYGKSLAQIVLRWNVERGSIPLARSRNESRLKENFDIFDFSLTKEEVDGISSLNRDFQYLPTSRICPGF